MSNLKFESLTWLGLGALILAPTIWAQNTNSALGVPNNLDDQKAVMQAQIEIMRKEQDLKSALKALALSDYQPLPRVLSLSIRGHQAQVRLQLASGVSANFMAGDLVAAGVKITEIKEREVFVEVQRNSKAQRVPLEFAISPVSAPLSTPTAANGAGAIIPAELMPKLPFVPMPAVSDAKVQNTQRMKP